MENDYFITEADIENSKPRAQKKADKMRERVYAFEDIGCIYFCASSELEGDRPENSLYYVDQIRVWKK